MTAVVFAPPVVAVPVAAVCPWCEQPRRTDKVGYFIGHRARQVKGFLRGGGPRVYLAKGECPGSGEHQRETKAANET